MVLPMVPILNVLLAAGFSVICVQYLLSVGSDNLCTSLAFNYR
jgi:hypothetical protein